MRIHLFEHDPFDFPTNITVWAEKRGYTLTKTDVFRGEKCPSPEKYDWLMVMGGSQHAWEEDRHPWLVREKEAIAQALEQEKIILGICFGAQLLAEVLGGRVFPNREKEIGWHPVFQTEEGRQSLLFKEVPEKFITFHWHSDHYDIPPGCIPLAYNECTPNQAFVYPGRPILGLQFHPEYTLDLVKHFALEFGGDWTPGPYVKGKESILLQTESVPDTGWLMTRLLDNMEKVFGKGWEPEGPSDPGKRCPGPKTAD